ncbi:hypothetical protein Pmani_003678 [Petrolisthes manimaculis]|uniref:Phytanoyl-CoA dioxygenase family protein n=1 Tax=Petrolisthes manimaculis TaxID=1843537 RepID=A0AAE1QGA8_9EUCA|nr:hypothetical protein Pmani_003678 [Petrolisthes manimaculis]
MASEGPEFSYDAAYWQVTQTMKEAYSTHGYIIVRKMFSTKEVQKVKAALEDPEGVTRHSYGRTDGKDRFNKMVLWNHPGRDITGMLARTQRIAGTAEQMMGGEEIYHYHTKLIMKEAHTGGTFVWHQDYGYWYNNGCMAPEMISVFIPMDDADCENGCLQVLPGSHKFGRIDHLKIGEQQGADPERVEQALKKLKHVYVEMRAGDVLFFHCNLLHTSAANISPRRRWVFIVAFNKRKNEPYKNIQHLHYTPLDKVDDSALLACDVVRELDGKAFLNYNNNKAPHIIH